MRHLASAQHHSLVDVLGSSDILSLVGPPSLSNPPPPPNRRPNSADFADLICRFVGFLDFADLFC